MSLPKVASPAEWRAARPPPSRDTTLAYVSRAPLDRIERHKARKGWTFPWYSSHGSDFNYDFHVTLDAAVAPVEYHYRSAAEHAVARLGALRRGRRIGRDARE